MGYKEVLYRWAGQYIPEGGKVTSVEISFSEGQHYSEFTYDSDSLIIYVTYIKDDVTRTARHYMDNDIQNVVNPLGTLLTELFQIEDNE